MTDLLTIAGKSVLSTERVNGKSGRSNVYRLGFKAGSTFSTLRRRLAGREQAGLQGRVDIQYTEEAPGGEGTGWASRPGRHSVH